jgi:hypothetical protein
MKLTEEFKVRQFKFIAACYFEFYEGLIKYFREQCSINGPKTDEVVGGRRKLTTGCHNFYSSSGIIRLKNQGG